MPLLTAETGLRRRHEAAGFPPAEWPARLYWPDPERPFTPPSGVALGPDVAVYVLVNDSRWVIECPDCPSAQLAADTDRRFYCIICSNRAVGGLWRPVIWPDDTERAEVERILLARPEPKRRHWVPLEAAVVRVRRRGYAPGKLPPRQHWPAFDPHTNQPKPTADGPADRPADRQGG